MKQHHIKPILCDDEVKPYFGSLHRASPIVTIAKAANNGTLVCKRFCIMCLLAEFGTFVLIPKHIRKWFHQKKHRKC